MTKSSISEKARSRLREEAGNRCGYCLTHQDYVPWTLEIEHILPRAKGGRDEEDNIWLACHTCNLYKGSKTHGRDPLMGLPVQLFNPRHQKWSRHFQWSQDGTLIEGKTASGRATVLALNMNNLITVTVRNNWIKAGWHPPIVD